jgi:putative tryptophan/tyrosine transport system substrate-binding protein
MNRRDFVRGSAATSLLAGASPGWRCSAAQAQQPMVGFLDGSWGRLIGVFGSGLREAGIAGKAEFSGWAGSTFRSDEIARFAERLVKREVALIVAFSTKSALAAQAVAAATPIVFLAEEPVAAGLVENLHRPGGNLTGAACPVSGLTARRIDLMRQLVPAAGRVVLVSDPSNTPVHNIEIREARAIADARGLQLSIVAWTGEHGIEPDLAALPRDRKAVLVFGGGLPFVTYGATLTHLAARYELPAIHAEREAVDGGGMISFGTRFEDAGYAMGVHAAHILKGGKPADVPIQQITKTEMVINLWGAKTFGLQIPSAFLAHADEVIT